MKYTPPIGGAANDPYVDANPATGVEGSPVPAAAIEDPMREIINVITAAGLTPDDADLTQLYQAIQRIAVGGDYKASVRATTTANLAALSGLLTVDGIVLVADDRVLVKDQTAAAENGIYLASAGAWTRTTDADAAGELTSGAIVPVESGTLNADTLWMLTTDGAITIGTTALTWQIKSGDASTTRKGQVQLATSAEVLAGTDALKAVTSAGLLAGLLGAGGIAGDDYLTIPFRDKSTGVRRNLIVQWGLTTVAASNANTDVTLPLAYPNAHQRAYISVVGVAAATQAGATPLSLTQIRLNQSYTGGAQQMAWLSIGY